MTSPARPGIRVCFCSPTPVAGDWDAHESFCLMLDWAVANGKISLGYYRRRLGMAQAELGITDEEIAAEAGQLRSAAEDVDWDAPTDWDQIYFQPYPLIFDPLRNRLHEQPRHERVSLDGETCYRSEYGFMVHVKDTCRC